MKAPTIAAIALASLFALTGCVQLPSAVSNDPPPQGTNRPAETEPEPEPEPDDSVGVFGDTFEYEDGVTVTVSEPVPFTPSEYAFVGDYPAYLRFTVTIVNGSDETFDIFGFATLQSGNTEAEEVFDTDSGLSSSPSTPLLPGREAVWDVGFGVDNPDDLVFSIAPGVMYTDAIFTIG